MSTRVIANNPEIARVGVEFFIENFNDGMTSFWKDIALVSGSTTQSYIEFMQEGDFRTAPVVGENSVIQDDDIFYGNNKKIYPVKRGLGYSISSEAWETDQYGRFTKVIPAMKLAFNITREQACADRINNATSSDAAYLGPDGKSVAATDHPVDATTPTASNLTTQAFGPTALETMVQNMILTVSHRGNPAPRMGPYDLMIHPSQNFYAERVVYSAGQAGTANREDNRIGKRINKIISSPFFTATTFWSLREANARRQPFAVLERRGIRVTELPPNRMDRKAWTITEMYAFYENGWRGYHHSTGTGL